MFTLRQYLLTLDDPHGLTRTLGDVELCRDARGRPLYSAGNSAAVFRIRHEGRIRALRCYFRPMRHLCEIYDDRYLPAELYLFTSPATGVWADVVLTDWIEGETLQQAVATAAPAGDRSRLAALSAAFDALAAELTSDDRAHGDLKPDNIIVSPDGSLHLIDLDAMFLPAFAGEPSPEMGTAAFQHPARTAADFDASLDDYPAALIATALHALKCDPSLLARSGNGDGLLFTPRKIHSDPVLDEALALFEREGMAAEYRIARLLRSTLLRLPELPKLLRMTSGSAGATLAEEQTPELFVRDGLWGYRTPDRTIIEPLYDCGFEFTEGLAAVRLGRAWHFIDTAGRTAIRCPECEAVKPFRNGRATIIRDGRRREIDHSGREFDI